MPLILCGFPCCGKTTFGRAVAEKLGVPFADSDEKLGDIKRLYAELGEEGFRKKEGEVLKGLFPLDGVLSIGGGTLVSEENRDLLKNAGKIIYLHSSFPILFERIKKRGFPLYTDLSDPWESLQVIAKSRFLIFETYCHKTLETDFLSPDSIIQKLCEIYE